MPTVIPELVDHRDEVIALSQRFAVSSLAVFGSAVTGAFDPDRSDVDFLVELDPPAGVSRFDAYFGLKGGCTPARCRAAADCRQRVEQVVYSRRRHFAPVACV